VHQPNHKSGSCASEIGSLSKSVGYLHSCYAIMPLSVITCGTRFNEITDDSTLQIIQYTLVPRIYIYTSRI